MKVLLWPPPETLAPAHGIGRVVHAQHKYLPKLGVEFVTDVARADVVACHTQQDKLPRVEVLHLHGAYWTGDVGSGEYVQWHHDANTRIVASARRARILTVPSEWVAMPFKRDMRVSPVVVGHGLELEEWSPGTNGGYVLWNKNRDGDVCNPAPAYDLAMRGAKVISTFAPQGVNIPATMKVIGVQSHEKMRDLVRNADVYLATTQETFGIGTLEALACGVPVLGYDWGGTRELVRHELDGYLVPPGDVDGLLRGLEWIRKHRAALSMNAQIRAGEFTWTRAMEKYVAVYEQAMHEAQTESHAVAVVITNHNYARYLEECIESVLHQTHIPDEIIVVDDGSTDDSRRVIDKYVKRGQVRALYQTNQGVASARNSGVMATRAPYVVCLDADDTLYPRFVEICSAEMKKDRGLGLTWGSLTLRYENGSVRHHSWNGKFSWEWQASAAIPPNTCVPTGAMFRRSLWERSGGYKQEYAPGEDAEFYTRGLSVGFTARQATDDPLLIYRVHEQGAHKRPYVQTDDFAPWMRDRQYPLAAPADVVPPVRSYSQPRVSVIIPVGPGHAQYLPQALDSLLGQTMRDWEVIVVNDSEEDLPFRTYPFMRVIDIGKEHGAGEARNEGIHFARAPLVFFLDADDYLHHDALAHLCKAYAGVGGRYVYGDWWEQSGAEKVKRQSPNYTPEAWLDLSNLDGKHITAVLMATADARKVRFDETLEAWEDWDFFARCALAGIQGLRVAEPLVIVRRDLGTRTRKAFNQREKVLSILQKKFKGVEMSKACCGGNAESILAAKRAFMETPMPQNQLSLRITARGSAMNPSQATASAPDSGITPVRLEFTGNRTGAVTYHGQNGRAYRGGRSPATRYINAHPDDVEMLTRTGEWRAVGMVTLSAPENVESILPEDVRKIPAKSSIPVEDFAETPIITTTQAIETGEGVVKRKRLQPKPKSTGLRDLGESA
jgi:glycosyltransferase involved in cell wall biosynthesis